MAARFLTVTLVVPCLLFACTAIAATKTTVSGTFTLDGKAYPVAYVAAVTAENPFDDTKEDVQLTFTDVAVSPDSDPNELATAGKVHGIIVTLNDQKEASALTVLGISRKSGNAVCEFEPAQFDTQIAAGRLFLKEPEESFGHKYLFDVKFSAPVKDMVFPPVDEKTGTALPPGGGEPGAAYMAYDKAIASGDLNALVKFASDERMKKQMSDPKAKDMLEIMKSLRATGIKIVKGYISGDRATLHLEGKEPDGGAKIRGTVRMVKVKSQWCLEKESWKAAAE